MSNSSNYPEAWSIFVECVRKWPDDNSPNTKWIYGIPNPENKTGYLYSDCPGKLFNKFKSSFYKSSEQKLKEFRDFLDWLDYQEGKRI